MPNTANAAILKVDPRFLRRKKVIRIVVIVVVALALIISALSIRYCIVARGIRQELATAAELSCRDTIAAHQEALQIVDRLREDHPSHDAIRARYAWQHLLVALQVGPVEPHVQAVRSAVDGAGAGPHDQLLDAARIGLMLLDGEAAPAVTQARALLDRAPTCRECGLLYAYALVEEDQIGQAVSVLDSARMGRPPFVPALSTLARVLREQRRYGEARNALNALTKIAPDHQGAIVESVLIEIEVASGRSSTASKVAATLEPTLAKVTVDDAHVLRAALRYYTKGRLAYLAGNDEAAVAALAKAVGLRSDDQTAAMWQAKALRRARRHLEAVESLSAFPDTEETSLGVLEARANILMDLHKTTDAAAPIAVLLAQKVKAAPLLEGRRLYLAGEFPKASASLRTASSRGFQQAHLELAEMHVAMGQARDGQKILESTTAGGAIGLCAAGLKQYFRGSFKRARAKFFEAAKAGGRCGHSLSGRLLVGTGMDERHRKGLVAALEEREDLRDRVALGRLVFRLDGRTAAQQELDRVRKTGPQGALLLAELSAAYLELGAADVAAEVAAEGIAGTHGHPRLVALAARLARDADDLSRSEELVKQGLAKSPSSTALIVEKAANLAARRRYRVADGVLEKALLPGEHFAEAACLRADIQAKRGERRESQIQLAKLINRNIRNAGFIEVAPARICLAQSYIRRGRNSYGKARANLGIMRRRGLLWAEIPYIAGILAGRQNKRDRANTQYRRALDLDVAHRASWDQLIRHKALEADERARFQKLWPDE